MCVAVAPLAPAAWHEASTDHFVLYADEKASVLRRKAERLERMHDAFVRHFDLPDTRPSPSNRLTVFVLRDVQQVNRYYGTQRRQVAGFFVGKSGASTAFVPGGRARDAMVVRAEQVLLHEYAHFLIWGKNSTPLPPWLNEGLAEFAGSTLLADDDSLIIGTPTAEHRERLAAPSAPDLATVLRARSVADVPKSAVGGFYATSFLLYHYLTFQPDGERQLEQYVEALSAGAPLLDAATYAFGDLDALSDALLEYRTRTSPPVLAVPEDWLVPGEITVRKLPRGEAKVMPFRMWLMRGVPEDKAAQLLTGLQPIVERHQKNDAAVATLARMQYAARQDAQAVDTAQRVIDRTPDHLEANLVKMVAMHRQIAEAENRPEAWKATRRQIVLTNRLESDHPLPLRLYYAGTRAMHLMYGGPAPSAQAFSGMRRALELAPYDDKLRAWVGASLMQAGRLEEARLTLLPLTTDVHRSGHREMALKAIGQIDRVLAEEASEGLSTP